MMNIEISIEKLVLEGFAASDRYAIGEAVSAEITRLLTEQGIPAGWQNSTFIPRVDAGSFNISNPRAVTTIGGQIAQAVIGAVNENGEIK